MLIYLWLWTNTKNTLPTLESSSAVPRIRNLSRSAFRYLNIFSAQSIYKSSNDWPKSRFVLYIKYCFHNRTNVDFRLKL